MTIKKAKRQITFLAVCSIILNVYAFGSTVITNSLALQEEFGTLGDFVKWFHDLIFNTFLYYIIIAFLSIRIIISIINLRKIDDTEEKREVSLEVFVEKEINLMKNTLLTLQQKQDEILQLLNENKNGHQLNNFDRRNTIENRVSSKTFGIDNKKELIETLAFFANDSE